MAARLGAVLRRLHEDGGPAGTGLGRRFAVLMPIFFASAGVNSADVPWYLHMPLPFFAAWLPLLVILWFAAAAVSRDGTRRALRGLRPRPKVAYLLLAVGWVTAGLVSGLAAWAAGARPTGPGVGEDWIATGLVWGTMICICATVMMAGCALTARGGKQTRGQNGRVS